jgi:geranylgeranyl diphosphate synthase type II
VSDGAQPADARRVDRGPGADGEPAYPEELRDLVERYLQAIDFAAVGRAGRLVEAMRYSLLAGGKRIRPVLTLAVAESLDEPPERLLPAAAALELIHTYSLIHDDLPAIDDDELRRGVPTCHVVYGEDIAILAGDGLFAEAFRLLIESQEAPAETVLAVLGEIARATGVQGMVGGQYMDVTAEAGRDDDLRLLHTLKTGRLIEAAVVTGALLSGVGAGEPLAPYRGFAREIGLLFQIVDDILDVRGEDEALGKPTGSDERLAKLTYVSRHGVEGAQALAAESYARAGERLRALPGRTDSLAAVTDYIFRRRC